MSWVQSLKNYNNKQNELNYNKNDKIIDKRDAESEVLKELRQLYLNESNANCSQSSSAYNPNVDVDIPKFYYPRAQYIPPEAAANDDANAHSSTAAAAAAPSSFSSSSFHYHLRREARTRYLERRAEQLLDDRELSSLWDTMQQNQVQMPIHKSNSSSYSNSSSPSRFSHHSDVDKRLNYDGFLLVANSLPPTKANRYFRPSAFLKFPRDNMGTISARALFRYITKKVQLTRLRISLTCYDELGHGYMREQDLENYIYDQIASLPPLAALERDFYPYYVFTAVRKFFFFLDPSKKSRIKIKDIVHSPIMAEFDALRYPHGVVDSAKSKRSWFSAQHTQDVYGIYLALDMNQNGMLSKSEFSRYNGGSLTSVFVDGVFQQYRMYLSKSNELEMDYKTFLDFVLAMEYKQTPASIAYFFKILDINAQSYLNIFTLNYWFRAVCEKMTSLGHEPVDISDVIANEVFDMICPVDPYKICLSDLLACRCGHTVISILIDVNGFWKYDNRETLMHNEEEEN